jgi:hypothetical protein
MLFGHNTNVVLDGIIYHVQTEDRGANHAFIDTTVHCRGRVMHRRTNTYADLLPLDAEREQALRLRLDEQHRSTVEEMRSGALHLPPPPPEPPRRGATPPATPVADAIRAPNTPLAAAQPPAPTHLKLELLNARTWLQGKNASLQILVRDASSNLVSGAGVTVRVDGASGPVEFLTSSNDGGRADLEFEMPRLAAGEVTLVIQAGHGSAQGQLRFSLRAKPKVPGGN